MAMMSTTIPMTRSLARVMLAGVLALITSLAYSVEVIKAPNDPREYRALTLENAMKVILISDSGTDLAAASLSIDVGSNANPPGREGLAHFLEHMLFLGTAKYPQPGEYKDYMSRHGGQDNAYTAQDETNYFFEIKASKLEGALDRFAQFFIDPLFNAEYVERERAVVHSEFLGRMKSDHRGAYSATQTVLNPNHPASYFAVGNLETLADRDGSNVRDELIAFYRRYYSANRMALTVIGREPLDELERWVRDRFSQVTNHNVAKPVPDVALFEAGRLPAILDVVPTREERSIAMTFPIAPIVEHWRTKPITHLAHLIGHEGEGSLLVALKQRGWAKELSAGPGYADDHSATFNIRIELTRAGMQHVDSIVALTFEYIDLIRRDGIEQWIFDENRRLSEIEFQFQEKAGPLSLVRAVSSVQHVLPQSEVIRGNYAFDQYDPELIRSYLDALHAENMLLTRIAPDLDTDKKTRWYDTPYRITEVSARELSRWNTTSTEHTLALPKPNPFIPNRLAIINEQHSNHRPLPIMEADGFTLWHHADGEFALPKAAFFFSLRTPVANASPRQHLLSELYVALTNDALDAFAYPADLAGLGFNLYTHMRGFSVRISGYDERQPELLDRILEAMTQRQVDPARFLIHKADIKRQLLNATRNQPYNRAMERLRDLVVKPNWSRAEQLAVIDGITAQELERFIDSLFANVNVVALAHGNITNAGARAMGRKLYTQLVGTANVLPVPRGQVRRLRRGDRLAAEFAVDHPESASVLYLQGPDKAIATRARAGMVAQILSSPFFDHLRTERKLGYVVFANAYPVLDTAGLVFIAQSPIADSATLLAEMRSFLEQYADTINQLSKERLEEHKRALIARIMEEERQLTERTDRYWNEIDRENVAFDTREQLVSAIRALDTAELAKFYQHAVVAQARRQLVIGARGEKGGPSLAPSGSVTAEALGESHGLFPG